MNVRNCHVDAYAFVSSLPDVDLQTVAQMRCLNKDWAFVAGPEMEARMVRLIADHLPEILLPDGTYLPETVLPDLTQNTVHIKDTLLDLGKLARLVKILKALKVPADSKGQPMPDLAWVFSASFFRDAQNCNSVGVCNSARRIIVANTEAFLVDVLKFASLVRKSPLTFRLWHYIYASFSMIVDATSPECRNCYTALCKLERCQRIRVVLNFDKMVLPGILKFHFIELLKDIEHTWRAVLLASSTLN